MDSTSWLNLPAAARAEADHAHGAAALGLMQSGWRVVGGRTRRAGCRRCGRRPPAGPQGFAWRAAMAETVAGGMR